MEERPFFAIDVLNETDEIQFLEIYGLLICGWMAGFLASKNTWNGEFPYNGQSSKKLEHIADRAVKQLLSTFVETEEDQHPVPSNGNVVPFVPKK